MVFSVTHIISIDMVDMLFLLFLSLTLSLGWKVMYWVQPQVALRLSRTPPASWYLKPVAGSPRAHFEETFERALPWLLAAMCGGLVMQLDLGVRIALETLLSAHLSEIVAFLEPMIRFLPL